MPKSSLLDSIEVKSPCTESWDEMSGNDQMRFCSHCVKHVHNLSEMTRADALKLVAKSEGNICVRFAKRPDGKLQTIDRPFYQIGRRARIAAGVAAATLSLSAMAYSQGTPILRAKELTEQTVEKPKTKPQPDPIVVTFTITDPYGAVMPGVNVTISNPITLFTTKTISDGEGVAKFTINEAGNYRLTVDKVTGFKNYETTLNISQSVNLQISLEASDETVIMGVISFCPGYYLDDAISENNYERVKDALKEGAELNPKDVELPPLHQAVILGHMRIVKLLLDYGANPNLRAEDGKVPLDHAYTDEMRDLLKEYGAKEF